MHRQYTFSRLVSLLSLGADEPDESLPSPDGVYHHALVCRKGTAISQREDLLVNGPTVRTRL